MKVEVSHISLSIFTTKSPLRSKTAKNGEVGAHEAISKLKMKDKNNGRSFNSKIQTRFEKATVQTILNKNHCERRPILKAWKIENHARRAVEA